MAIKIIETTDTELLATLNHDVQEIHAEIEPAIFKKYSKDEMKKLFNEALAENIKSYLAYWGDEPAGYLLISVMKYPETPFRYEYSVLFIDQICVAKKFKGKNIGKELINKAKSLANEQGFKRIELDFWCKNSNAGQFFRTQGFNTHCERMHYDVE